MLILEIDKLEIFYCKNGLNLQQSDKENEFAVVRLNDFDYDKLICSCS